MWGLGALGLSHDGGNLLLTEVGRVNDKVGAQLANVALEDTLPDLDTSLLRDLRDSGCAGKVRYARFTRLL